MLTAGEKFRRAVDEENPLQVVGVIHAYAAMMAEKSGFRALYISGAGVANASFGLPDLGFTTLEQVAEDTRRIARATSLPILVDVDTGWDDAKETAEVMVRAGAGAIQIEDQVPMKRCGHRPNKQVVSIDEMCGRLHAAAKGRGHSNLVIMARTDAAATEGVDAAVGRAVKYVEAGADIIFAEALGSLDEYRRFTQAVGVPVLANLTEFGKTPLYSLDELRGAGVRLALYPLSAFRAMNAAALKVFRAIRGEGSQKSQVDAMQTRAELYEFLEYHKYEQEADRKLKG